MYIHILDDTDNNIRMILPPTADGVAPVVRTYTVAGLNDPNCAAFDGTHIHLGDDNDDNIRMILPPTADGEAPIVRTYTTDGLRNPKSLTFDGTHIHIGSSFSGNVRMILPPTADGEAPVVRTYTVPGETGLESLTFDGAYIHLEALTNFGGVLMFLPPTSDGAMSHEILYTFPDDLVSTGGMAFDGTHIHLSDFVGFGEDYQVVMFLPPTANGEVAVVRTYTVAGADNVRGMTFDGAQDIDTRVVPTITFDDASGDTGGTTGVNIDFTESITGLLLSHLTASAGTLSNITGSGTSWQATLTFPTTGSGTVEVTLAENSTTPDNTEASASIDYDVAPLTLGWEVPSDPVDNTFSATLTSNYPITGVSLADFRLRIDGNSDPLIDLTAANTTLTQVAGTNNWRLDFVLVGTFDADYTIRLRAATVEYDGSSYPPSIFASDPFSIDSSLDPNADAVLNITLDATTVEQGEIVNALFTFNKVVTNFTADDVTVTTGATKGVLTNNGDNTYSMPITAPTTGSGNISVSVAEDAVSPGNNADSASFAYTAPVIILDAVLDITLDQTTVENNGVVNATFTFDKAVGGFTAADVNVTAGATKGTLTNEGSNVYTMPITAPSSGAGTINVSVAEDAVTPGNNSDSASFAYTEPVILDAVLNITLDQTTVEQGEVVNATFTFDSAITGFTAGDVTVSFGATKGTLTNEGNNVYTMPITAPSTGSGTVNVNVAVDRVSPGNNADSASFAYTEPVADPLTFGTSTIPNQEYVVGTAGTITLPEATGGVGAKTYSLSPATLPAGKTFVASTRVLAGTPTAVFTLQTFTYNAEDTDGNTVELTFSIVVAAAAVPLSLAWIVPTAPVGNTFSATLTSNHPITGVILDDFRLRIADNSEGRVDLTTANTTLSAVAGTNNWQLDIVLVGTFDADYTIRLRNQSVEYDGISYPPAFLFSDAFSIDSSLDGPDDAVLNITLDQTTVENGEEVTATFTFDSDITGFNANDVIVTAGATKGTLVNQGNNVHRMIITAPSTGAGTIEISVAEDVVSPGNNADSASFTYTEPIPTPDAVLDITLSDTAVNAGDVVTATFTYDIAITNFTADDVDVTAGATKGPLSNQGSNVYTMEITAPPTGSGNINVSVATDSVSPGNNFDIASFSYTTPTPDDAVLNITLDQTTVENDEVVNALFTFDSAIGGFVAADVTVTAGATKGTLTNNGNNTYSMPITAPSSGAGNISVSVSEDAVTPGNNADSASFAYTEADIVDTIAEIHIIDNTGDEVGVIAPGTAGGTQAVLLRRYDLPAGLENPQAAAIDIDGNIHVADSTSDSVTVFAHDTAADAEAVELRNYLLPVNISVVRAIVSDTDGNMHVADTSGDEVDVIPHDTADGDRAVAIRTYNLPDGVSVPTGMAIDLDGNIHVCDSTDDNIRVFDPATADGQQADTIRTYLLPEDLNNPETLTTDGDGNILIGDISDDNITVIAYDTADGDRAVAIRVYSNPEEITASQAMVYIPGIEPPTPTDDAVLDITLDQTTVENSEVVNATFTFDSDITNFTASDVDVTSGATKGILTNQGSNVYTMPITAPSSGSGSVEVSVNADVVSPGNNADSASFAYTVTTPTDAVLDITLSDTAVNAGDVVTATFTFDRVITGFTRADVSASGGASRGTLVNQGGNVYTMDITAPSTGSGTIAVSVSADRVSPGNNSDSASFTYTTPAPDAAVLNITTSNANISAGGTASITFTFDRAITGFNANDVDLNVGSKGTLANLGNNTYRMTVTAPTTGNGTMTISVDANSVSPGNNADSVAVNYTEVVADAVLSITLSDNNVSVGAVVDVDFDFSKSVTGFTSSDVAVAGGGVLVTFNGSGNSYAGTVRVPASGSGTVTISVAADVVSPGNNAVSIGITYSESDAPVFNTSSASVTMNGDSTRSINLFNIVSNAEKITSIFGIRSWASFNGRVLRIDRSPILSEERTFVFTFRAKGIDRDTVGRVILTVRSSPLAALNNMILMRSPLNYEKGRVTITGGSTVVTETSDNDHRTFTTQKSLTFDMSENSAGTKISYVSVKGKNIDSYLFDPNGETGFTGRVIPTTVKPIEGRSVDTTFDGFQHDLVPLGDTITTDSVDMVFTGTNVEIYSIMLLESGYEIDANCRFSNIVRGKVDRTGGIHQEATGGIDRYAPIDNERHKHICQYTLVFEGNEQYDELLQWIEDNENCAHVEEFNRHPHAVYLATFPGLEYNSEYITRYKEVGNSIAFSVEER